MEYDNIKCGTNAIYKIKIDGIDNQLVINELFDYKEMGYELNISTDILTSKNIRKLYLNCNQSIESVYSKEYQRTIKNSYQSGWVFELPNNSHGGEYHKHIQLSPLYPQYITDVAWVYYLQLPNNLNENEGKLLFKDEYGNEVALMPELGYIYAFPGGLEHRPESTTQSTIDRIVAVGNIKFNW
jgi:hypothetical protein